jgi:hypothetical protein
MLIDLTAQRPMEVDQTMSGSEIVDPDDVGISESKTAKILNVKVPTLATWRSLGKGPRFRKIGRRIEYTPRFIREYQAASERTPESAATRRQRHSAAT